MSELNKNLEPEWKDFFGTLLNIICRNYDMKSLFSLFKSVANQISSDLKLKNVQVLLSLKSMDPLTFISYVSGNKSRLKIIEKKIKDSNLILDVPNTLDKPNTTFFTNVNYITDINNRNTKELVEC